MNTSPPTPLFFDDRFLGHDTGQHPENPHRCLAVHRALSEAGLITNRRVIPFNPATDEQILRVHELSHLASLEELSAQGGGWIDADTMVGPDSLDVARLAAGAAVAAVDGILDGNHTRAFALGRPPGHHATRHRAMGFCLLNSVAIAAAHARARGINRVAIVDWDVHHGNGTQDIFWQDPDVWYASIHQSPLYPGTGARADIGIGPGTGTTLNRPLPPGSGNREWVGALRREVGAFVQRAQPDMILLSAGYDAHRDDPIGGCNVDDDGFAELTRIVVDFADSFAAGKLVAVLEGGYDPQALGRCVVRSVEALDGQRRQV